MRSLRELQIKLACFVLICGTIGVSSCHSKNEIAQNKTIAPKPIASQKSSIHSLASSTTQSLASTSAHSSGHHRGGKNIAKLHPRKTSPKADTYFMNADASPKANYKIAGIGKAQDPSTIYNWNWARDFGGTVDTVTISF
jgi:hypothetical protein